ncbi:MAG: thioredoxin family protein [Bacteroidetes bacterium HGW-Bacteroidetes-1]|jgi:peroxiredoxin|nr:MAG: thioredoxin family protein [Bacteroidetes bacterium HGW-Bacteroidetes-1]
MALTSTNQITLGFKAPAFSLVNVPNGKTLTFSDIKGEKGTLVMFICNHCPYVKHVIHELVHIGNDYLPKGIGFVAINSNDVIKHPEDSPENMKIFAFENKFPFPYLFDETQEVAKSYDAACTPDFDLFDANDTCVYRGRMDASRPGNSIPVTGNELRNALNQLLNNETISATQQPSMGCNIKWKAI